ncbi:SusD/RagB family nutrient-binding outer membrane lipoprotein [Emticicia sp. ODNR4P]|nr:SusD/RagB family nutrient-binding outer membrane lipoprotein [Emticicia sp. ODNR4P]
MKKLIFLYAFLFLALTSCTEGMEELNHDPEGVSSATAGSFMNTAILEGVNTGLSRSHRLNNELMQVTVSLTEGNTVFHRYVLFPSESDYMWSNYYLSLTNIEDMIQKAKAMSQPNYLAIGLTLKAWLFANLTDIYGDIPYSQALKGYPNYVVNPTFDKQEDVYKDLIAKLDTANALYDVTKTLTLGQDALFGADKSTVGTLRWKKFTNSLRLRLLMRGEAKSPAFQAQLKTMLSSPDKYPLMQSADESAALKFTQVTPLLNPFTSTRDYDFNGANAVSEFFIKTLSTWSDPRLDIWATKASGKYTGIPSGYTIAEGPAMNAISSSKLNKNLKTSLILGTILQYAEVEFLLAEAALKGYTTDSPKDHYEKGIAASMKYWGATQPTDFLTRSGVAYNGTLQQIMTQKYIALFFNDMQQWFEYKRTGYPVLPVGKGVENNGKMPMRLKYPLSTQSLNRANYDKAVAQMGADDINTKTWWTK